jgi:hypothetical protein
MDIGAAIEQERNRAACRSEHSPMQRRASRAVTAIDETWFGIQKVPDTQDIVCLRSAMNRMIVARRNSSPALASLLKQSRDALMPTVSGHFDEAAIVRSIPLRVCARFDENLHGIQMSRACREVNRLGVPVLRTA